MTIYTEYTADDYYLECEKDELRRERAEERHRRQAEDEERCPAGI